MNPRFSSSKVATASPGVTSSQSVDEIKFLPATDYRPLPALLCGVLVLVVLGLIIRIQMVILLGGAAAALAGIGAVYVVKSRRATARGAQARAAAAARFGMDFVRKEDEERLPWLRTTWVMSECDRIRIWNLMRGGFDGVPIAIADVVGHGRDESDRDFAGTAVMMPALGDGPDFIMRPVDWGTGVRRRFSRRQVVLDDTPQGAEFSRQYELWVNDADSLPFVPSDEGTAFLATRPGWLVERNDGQLLIAKLPPRPPLVPPGAKSFRLSGGDYRPDSPFVTDESLPALIKHAVAIRALMR
ncbi:hypothetical protein I41_26090 [Lacipirellula limnantheis]|uniref:DUF3137 domain-containing protein n=1 Tax=Lacipirellula limnantheis TaxID=2528024 RepID=A0A517TYG6_9BACT|nr:hypothetical protein I41_26090 [Lacipirellula limnantheis]